jgi:hypothetical protein
MVKLGVAQVVAASFANIRRGWTAAPGALGVAVAVAAVSQAVGLGRPSLSILPFAELAAATLATGALYRVALSQAHPGDDRMRLGPAGLQWGAVEWWVLGANLVVGVILALTACVLIFAWAVGVSVLAASHAVDLSLFLKASKGDEAALSTIMAGPTGVLSASVFLPGLALLIYLWARLLLTAILAVDLGRLDLGRAWTLTHGATAALAATLVVVFLCELVAGSAAVFLGGALGALTGQSGDAALAGVAAGSAIATGLSLPMTAGAAAYVYRREVATGPWAASTFK